MIKTEVTVPIGYTESDVRAAVLARLPIQNDEIKELRLLRATLDLKDKRDIKYRLSVGLSFSAEREANLLRRRKFVSAAPELSFELPLARFSTRPVVIGAGPCGIFAALILAEAGAEPIVIERGLPVEERTKSVSLFSRLGILDTECNVQFGEGGAGTYSDGKLKVGSLDKYKMKVLSEFVAAGATPDITYSATAHLGTDRLPAIVAALRDKIISLGGEFIYSAKFTDFKTADGCVSAVTYMKNGEEHTIPATDVILATGHSAKDTYEALLFRGVRMVPKGFGIGVRIEHPREYMNNLVYGKGYDSRLETASYHLVTHLKNGRSVYSFCMCPGGTVVPAASEQGGVVTNGMSELLRNGENSNAALLVSVTPEDFGSTHALAGIELQRKIERAAYLSAGENFSAPVTTLAAFSASDKAITLGSVRPSYPVGTAPCAPEKYLPEYITDSLRASLSDFEEWMPGFSLPDAVLTGAETRSTAPVRLLRGESYEIEGIGGLYASGEGAGYSGGIVSSAVDGVRTALSIIEKYKS
ncbi:MAG: hypothetical protein IJ515_04425 [Clostridia bacterium]|nr:hypothetical protein [Clostridia bacterium]